MEAHLQFGDRSVGIAFQSNENLADVANSFAKAYGIERMADKIEAVIRNFRADHSSQTELEEDETVPKVVVYYRISDQAIPENSAQEHRKPRPSFIKDDTCLFNALRAFSGMGAAESKTTCTDELPPVLWWADFHVIADTVSDTTYNWLKKVLEKAEHITKSDTCNNGLKKHSRFNLSRTTFGHGAGSFKFALDLALEKPSDTIAYFLEDDYLHVQSALAALREGITIADYVSLYDHPDKYVNTGSTNSRGTAGGAYVTSGGEISRYTLPAPLH